MNILFLSDNFPPEGNAPATRLYEHATRWVRDGHQVTVVTCAPNFPEGKVFEGYRNAWRTVEDIEGIRVVRVKTYITANEGFLKRTLDYVSFMLSGSLFGLFEKRPDVVVATSPQFFTAVGGWMLSGLRRVPYVFELRDLWPASIVAVGAMKESRIIRWLEKLELFLYRRADAIISVTESFKRDLVGRGIDGGKIEVILNGVDLDRYAPVEHKDVELAQQHDLAGKFVIGYIGTHGMAHALDKVVEAADQLRDRDDVRFLMVGGGAVKAEVEQRVSQLGLSNVVMISRQPKEMMPRLWSLCDVALIPLRNTPVFETVIPSKMFEAMGMGIPILMSLPEGEATGIVKENDVGICVPPEDPSAMAVAVRNLVDNVDERQRLAANCIARAPDFSRDKKATELLDILQRCAARNSA